MTWWALLYGFSMLARYHPAEWAKVLDVDKSELAVPLEDALEVAVDAVPHLILEALIAEPVIFHR